MQCSAVSCCIIRIKAEEVKILQADRPVLATLANSKWRGKKKKDLLKSIFSVQRKHKFFRLHCGFQSSLKYKPQCWHTVRIRLMTTLFFTFTFTVAPPAGQTSHTQTDSFYKTEQWCKNNMKYYKIKKKQFLKVLLGASKCVSADYSKCVQVSKSFDPVGLNLSTSFWDYLFFICTHNSAKKKR